ncbi:hypothetical protein PUV47_01180 [Pseudovibrio exalbescens]|uniref:hypothetical protein n=1 Tax=Pseudovibrio exalbescens TaxID=197461 RepID=UPI0023651BE0|nr:hypothetical protein [Pseudovibrio exalbescens]MDD7908513.1 hypothetical protein [Pseudovibrio exalbescens]
MIELTLAGAIGAALGAYIGWLDCKILWGTLQAAVTKRKQTGATSAASLERAEPHLRKLIFVITMFGFPIIGFLAGQTIAG